MLNEARSNGVLSLMRMAITAAVLTLTVSCHHSPPPLEHARSDFTTTVDGQEVVLTYEGTHDVIQNEDPDIRLLVLVHHDGRLNSVGSFNYVWPPWTPLPSTGPSCASTRRPWSSLPG